MTNDKIDSIFVSNEQLDIMKIIRHLIRIRENSFCIFDVDKIVARHKQWKQKLPRVTPYYAVKCNANYSVLKILAEMGVRFDCSSMGEIKKALDMGVSSDNIIFSNPTKYLSHIRFARQKNVSKMTFDSADELYKIKEAYPSARLLLRIRSDAGKCTVNMGIKHSCDPLLEGPELLRLARQLQLDVAGIAFHVGTGSNDSQAYRRAIIVAKDLFALGRSLGFDMTILDIGGGFPGNDDAYFNSIANTVNEALDEYFPVDGNVDIVAEPGRYYVCPTFTLITRIHSRRMANHHLTGQRSMMYFIDEGVYSYFSCVIAEHMKPVPIALTNDISDATSRCSIWGPTCDPLDIVVEDAMLPILKVGEWLLFDNMGAYSCEFASDFSGFNVRAPIFNVITDSALRFLEQSGNFDRFKFDDIRKLLK